VTLKEVERPKYLRGQTMRMMEGGGLPAGFSMLWHTELRHSLDAKNPRNGWGRVADAPWYWYSSWIEIVRKHYEENAANHR
jgi:hypothetical protein